MPAACSQEGRHGQVPGTEFEALGQVLGKAFGRVLMTSKESKRVQYDQYLSESEHNLTVTCYDICSRGSSFP